VSTNSEAVHGGLWLMPADSSRVTVKVEPGGHHAEITFFGPFEVSLSMSEQVIVRCGEACAEALRAMRAVDDDPRLSWMHRAAPSE
jgi:hypothetical protein